MIIKKLFPPVHPLPIFSVAEQQRWRPLSSRPTGGAGGWQWRRWLKTCCVRRCCLAGARCSSCWRGRASTPICVQVTTSAPHHVTIILHRGFSHSLYLWLWLTVIFVQHWRPQNLKWVHLNVFFCISLFSGLYLTTKSLWRINDWFLHTKLVFMLIHTIYNFWSFKLQTEHCAAEMCFISAPFPLNHHLSEDSLWASPL